MRIAIHAALLITATWALGNPCARAAEPDAKGIEFFEKKIRPVLVEHCYKCHSAEANKSKGGLVVDTKQGLMEGGETGPAIIPGSPERSLLLKAMKHDGLKMPNGQLRLPEAIIADFEAWIKIGASDPRTGKSLARKGIDYEEGRKHWSYQPVKVAAPPVVKNVKWPRADMDRYVLAKIEARGLNPAPDAAPHTLLRRLTFDLTGLPPTPEELDAFEKAVASNPRAAVDEAVERLLESPRFGEHWARHWLDGVRFNATLPTSERYRDWVVAAFNADLPYERFVLQQLAGDLLPSTGDLKKDDAQLIATQMLCMNLREMDPVEGSIEVVGQHLLGVSVNCAKCHDHKFDAFSQADYYGLAGIFTSSAMAGSKNSNPKGIELKADKGAFTVALLEGKVADAHLLIRGEKSQKGPLIERRFPVVLAGDKQTPLGKVTKGSGRLELAQWIVDPKNPLTARVMVNRVWQRLTGQPIVGTPNDFGTMGDKPTHPELLDYLAERFVKNGWSVKSLIRDIVLSRTYQQSSKASQELLAADPDNTLLARMTLRRLSYEQILDNLQASAGTMQFVLPHPAAKKPVGGYKFGSGYRGLYLGDAGIQVLFDGADPELISDRREASVTAPQMLFFLNNRVVLELTGLIAKRAEKQVVSPAARAAAAFRLLYGRTPQAAELQEAEKFLKKHSFERFCHLLVCSNEFIYLD